MFSAPTKDKTTLFTMFFLLSQPQNRTETSVFTMFLQHQKSQRSQNAVFYSVFGTPFQKHWYLQCFVKTHARNTVNTNEFKVHFPWQQAANSKNTAIYSVSPQWFFQNVLFGPFLASETSQDKEGGGTPPPPFHILNFKIFTKSKTFGARGRENIANSAVLFLVGAENTVNYNVLGALWYLGVRSLWGRKGVQFLPHRELPNMKVALTLGRTGWGRYSGNNWGFNPRCDRKDGLGPLLRE